MPISTSFKAIDDSSSSSSSSGSDLDSEGSNNRRSSTPTWTWNNSTNSWENKSHPFQLLPRRIERAKRGISNAISASSEISLTGLPSPSKAIEDVKDPLHVIEESWTRLRHALRLVLEALKKRVMVDDKIWIRCLGVLLALLMKCMDLSRSREYSRAVSKETSRKLPGAVKQFAEVIAIAAEGDIQPTSEIDLLESPHLAVFAIRALQHQSDTFLVNKRIPVDIDPIPFLNLFGISSESIQKISINDHTSIPSWISNFHNLEHIHLGPINAPTFPLSIIHLPLLKSIELTPSFTRQTSLDCQQCPTYERSSVLSFFLQSQNEKYDSLAKTCAVVLIENFPLEELSPLVAISNLPPIWKESIERPFRCPLCLSLQFTPNRNFPMISFAVTATLADPPARQGQGQGTGAGQGEREREREWSDSDEGKVKFACWCSSSGKISDNHMRLKGQVCQRCKEKWEEGIKSVVKCNKCSGRRISKGYYGYPIAI